MPKRKLASKNSNQSSLPEIKVEPKRVKEEPEEEEEIEEERPECLLYQDIGKVLWTKLGRFPWWPCIVAINPKSYYKAPKTPKIFVIFFGHVPEHAWVIEGNVIDYKGLPEFKTYAQLQVDQARYKSQRQKANDRYSLNVPSTLYDNWKTAIEQADRALETAQDNRISRFFTQQNTKSPETNLIEAQESANQITINKKRAAVMTLLDGDLSRLTNYSEHFGIDEKILVSDYFGPEFVHSDVDAPGKDALFKRFEITLKDIERIMTDRLSTHGYCDRFRADCVVLIALESRKKKIPMLEMDVIYKLVALNKESKDSVYEKLWALKEELFENKMDMDKLRIILDRFYLRDESTNTSSNTSNNTSANTSANTSGNTSANTSANTSGNTSDANTSINEKSIKFNTSEL